MLQTPDLTPSESSVNGGPWPSNHVDGRSDRVASEEVERPAYDALDMSNEIDGLVAVNLQDYERYLRAYSYPYAPYNPDELLFIQPGPDATSFDSPEVPNNWTTYVHPEGVRYFLHNDPDKPAPVLTEAWIYDEEVKTMILEKMAQIFQYMAKWKIDYRPANVGDGLLTDATLGTELELETTADRPIRYIQERIPVVLVLEVRRSKKIGYYFVDHPKKRLFWLERFDFSHDVDRVSVKHTPSHIGLEMTSQYWFHNEFFPDIYELTVDDVAEIDNILSFALGDVTSSTSSTINAYTADQLKYIQKTLHRYDKKLGVRRRASISDARTLFRALRLLYHERFLNLHGERGARLDYRQSIYYSQATDSNISMNPVIAVQFSSIWMRIIALLMFGGPAVHAERLRDVIFDGNISVAELAKYADSMVSEWRDVALYGTVLLGANISFLTIQSIDTAGSLTQSRTHSQRASYFSVGASMASIASSLVLLTVMRHREMKETVLFNYQVHASRWVLENHALAYALPLSLAIWSLLSFAVSFLILWFDSTDHVVMWVTGASCSIYAVFMISAVSTFYFKKNPFRLISSTLRTVVKWVGGRIVGKSDTGSNSQTVLPLTVA